MSEQTQAERLRELADDDTVWAHPPMSARDDVRAGAEAVARVETLVGMVVAHMDARNNSRRPPDDIDRALWSDVLDGGVSFADLLGLFADDSDNPGGLGGVQGGTR